MTDEEKVAQEKTEQEAAKLAKAEAAKKETKVKIQDGNVTLSEKDYNNLVEMKGDMLTYKEERTKLKADLEKRIEIDKKEKEEKLKADGKLKELIELKDKELIDIQTKIVDNEIGHALEVKALEAGIVKGEYIKLIDKSKVLRDEDTGAISGIDETIEVFKKNNPELFKSTTTPPPDTGQGGAHSGIMSDDDVRAITGKELYRIKREDPALYERWAKLATHGKAIPEHKE